MLHLERVAAPTNGTNTMATFILIPGGWQGGWVYRNLADILTRHGHNVVPVTLSGLGDVPAPMTNLESHIGEVAELVQSQTRDDLVLVGQSYGGMIVRRRRHQSDANPGPGLRRCLCA
ncbi:alpha/beta fold hydrolase [Brucella anthropi]|uniref:alpha/beta fold hydrolase n=2 Tax=Brucella anthropi TaxID=529 RepID=UPI0034E5D6BF